MQQRSVNFDPWDNGNSPLWAVACVLAVVGGLLLAAWGGGYLG
jgi:hypothetical protein